MNMGKLLIGVLIVVVLVVGILPAVTSTIGRITVQEAITLLSGQGYMVLGQGSEISGDLIPSANNTYDLGSTPRQWKELFVAGGTIHLGNIEVWERGGCLATRHFTTIGRNGESGYLKIVQGTAPTHPEAGTSVLWIDSSSKLQFQTSDSVSTEVVRFDSSGNLGVGEDDIATGIIIAYGNDVSVGGKVSIYNPANLDTSINAWTIDAFNELRFRADNTTFMSLTGSEGATAELSLGMHDNDVGTFMAFGDSTTAGGRLDLYNSAIEDTTVNYWRIEANDGLEFLSDTTQRLFISYDGNFGIGNTTTPDELLHLTGNNAAILLEDDSGSWARIKVGNSQLTLEADPDNEVSSTDIVFKMDGNEVARFYQGGNFGIGTATPDAKLEVNGYTMLGSDAPAIKVRYFTGTTDADSGTAFNHNIASAATKIISVTALVYNSAQAIYIAPNDNANWTYQVAHGATLIQLTNVGTEMRSQTYKVLIIYQE